MANKDFQNGFALGLTAGQGKEVIQVERTVQVDWLQEDPTQPDYIKNKPESFECESVQPDWLQEDSSAPDYIKNKPTILTNMQSDWEQNNSEAADYIKNRPFYYDGNAPVIASDTYGNREEAFGFVEGEQYKIEYLFDDNTTLTRYAPAISLEDTYGFKGPAVFDIYYYDDGYTSFDDDNHIYFFLADNAYVNDDGYPIPEEGKSIILVNNRIRNSNRPYKTLVSATIYVSKIKKLDTIFLNTTSEISENSSENEIPTAQAVFNLIQEALFVNGDEKV